MSMNEDVLEKVYQENLEERIIAAFAEKQNMTYEEAMDIYYNSSLADKIHHGEYGIQYLDYKILVEMLCEM